MTDFDALVQAWYAAHPDGTELADKRIDWRLAGFPESLAGATVVNLGCGAPVDERLWGAQAANWIAVDFTPEVVARGTAEGLGVEFLVADMRRLPLPHAFADLVLDFSSTDHMHDGRDRARAEAFRITKPGGHYVVTYANRRFFPDGLADKVGDYGFEHRFEPEEIEAEVRAAGFEIVATDTGQIRSGLVAWRAL